MDHAELLDLKDILMDLTSIYYKVVSLDQVPGWLEEFTGSLKSEPLLFLLLC